MPEESTLHKTNWQVYLIECSDGTLYTGITTDIDRRLYQHAHGEGAKYFRGRRPQRLMYLEGGHSRSSAGKREIEIKRLTRADKWSLLASPINELRAAPAAARATILADN
ncbi:MAG TPA: GIY-YIG nuclease family protein [Geobacteraceae bacterium]